MCHLRGSHGVLRALRARPGNTSSTWGAICSIIWQRNSCTDHHAVMYLPIVKQRSISLTQLPNPTRAFSRAGAKYQVRTLPSLQFISSTQESATGTELSWSPTWMRLLESPKGNKPTLGAHVRQPYFTKYVIFLTKSMLTYITYMHACLPTF